MSSERKSRESEVYSVGDWQKLKLLLWKNWVLQKNQKMQVFMALAFPVIFISILVLLRVLVLPETKAQLRFKPASVEDLKLLVKTVVLGNRIVHSNGSLNVPKAYLCYTPNTPIYGNIVKMAALILALNGSRPYDSPLEMERDMLEHNFLAGIQFEGRVDRAAHNGYPSHLNYSLRFPSELRTMPGPIIETWMTNHRFLVYDTTGPRNEEFNDGGVPVGYIREGFLPIQHAVTLSWLSKASGRSLLQFPRVRLQRFPFRAYTFDPLLRGLRQLLPFMVVLSFMYPCSIVTKYVASEKELQLKEIMKLIGVENWLHWIAWFLKSYLMLMLVVFLVMLLFKVNFYASISIFSYSHWLPILLFMHSYVIASICFCFMVAVFFSRASTAAAVTCILWFITYIPYSYAFYYYERLSLLGKLLIAVIFSNSALGFGFHIIMDFEGSALGVTWSNMFQTVSADDDITLFYIIMTLTASSVIYLSICLYVEQVFPGNYGIARRWNYFLKREFWCGTKPQKPTQSTRKKSTCRRKRTVGLQLSNLQKSYGKFKAVKGLNLKMYEDEITVLLGHNGAGKSTTLNMITGIVAPTAGTALVNGYDIRTELERARQSLGICPQNNILFMNMSVRDHIIFFSKLKGIRGSEAIKSEISKYVGILGLEDKCFVAAENLSGGMKRKLALCCALCGSTRVVLCDEPSSGIDAAGRKSLWELLQAEKSGRTVLLTTHYMDEADVLGDRIAILSDGKLMCHGTSFYLKRRYGTGYQLVCIMESGCDVSAVTQLINRHFPYLKPERELGTELTYRLPHQETKKFPGLLADLDGSCAKLKLSGYGLSVATLEDVFMEVNKEKRYRGGQEGIGTPSDFKTQVFDTKTRESRPWRRCLMRWQALLLKKVWISLRHYWLILIQVFLPILVIVLTIFNSLGGRIYYELPPLAISPFMYEPNYVILEGQGSPLVTAYAKHMEGYGKHSQLLRTGDLSFEDYILGLDETWRHRLDFAFVAGVSIAEKNATVWLNNKPLHTAPLTLNLWHNALARHYLGEDAGTYVTHRPLPYSDDTRIQRLNKGHQLGAEIAINLALCMCSITAFFAIPVIKERETRAKLLQFLSGVDAFAYWMTHLFCDFLVFILSALTTVGSIAAFQEDGYATFSDLSRYFVILLVFALGALGVSYVFSACFSDAATGFVRITIFNVVTGPALYMLYVALSFEAFHMKDAADLIAWYFRIFPHYGLASAFRKLHVGYSIRRGCSVPALKRLSKAEKCKKVALCCNIPGYFAWKNPGVLPEILYTLAVATFLFFLLITADAKLFSAISGAFSKLCKSPSARKKRTRGGGSSENPDVVEERQLVREMISSQRTDIPLLVNDIWKRYKKKLAVRGVSFHVSNGECFGLLGINGAGKTSVFKMLTGDTKITEGEAYIDGMSVSTQMRRVRHKIGYCPQFEAVFEDLTGRQNLRIYCLLRGVEPRFVAKISWTLAEAFGFQKHLDKQTKHYSGGNKRKLSTAIAIIGNPSVIYLDEPTSGMDPGARRHLWRIIGLIRTAGKSLVLTSHSMDECEALCTRLTIMVDGKFMCIGSTQSLKNQYSKGLVLKVKVKHKKKNFQRIVERSSSSLTESVLSVDRVLDANSSRVCEEIKLNPDKVYSHRISIVNAFILKNIPEAELKEERNGLLTYYIPQKQMLPRVFQLIESSQKQLNIEDYLITQTRLEEIFLDFALSGELREADVRKKKCGCC